MVKVYEIKQSVFADNDRQAELLRKELKEKGVFLLNLMSSPGAGKTTTLEKTMELLRDEMKIGVMEADIDSDVDAFRIAQTKVKTVQLHTGGMCHLDADMTRQGLAALGTDGLDLAILENVGNLVCPAEFRIGESLRITILSIPEGDDKVEKYPLMFTDTDCLVLNKYDMLPYFDFNEKRVCANYETVNPGAPLFRVSSRTGGGLAELADFISGNIRKAKA